MRAILTLLAFASTVAGTTAWAQTKPATKAAAAEPPRIFMAINEGGAANADATETLFRFQELTQIIEKELHANLVVVAVRDRNKLKVSLKRHEYGLLLARPNDLPHAPYDPRLGSADASIQTRTQNPPRAGAPSRLGVAWAKARCESPAKLLLRGFTGRL